ASASSLAVETAPTTRKPSLVRRVGKKIKKIAKKIVPSSLKTRKQAREADGTVESGIEMV
ncbi:hypothetical protein HK104_010909, partial [Borealophlyctis nickersoniae]